MARDLLIYGAGGSCKELAFFVTLDKNPKTAWKVRGFIDDTEHLQGKKIHGVPVLGGLNYLMGISGNVAVTISTDRTLL